MSQKELINEAEKAPLLIELNVSNFKITGLSLELHFSYVNEEVKVCLHFYNMCSTSSQLWT